MRVQFGLGAGRDGCPLLAGANQEDGGGGGGVEAVETHTKKTSDKSNQISREYLRYRI